MNLTLLSPQEKKTLAIAWIEVNTAAGNYVIQPSHVPTVFLVSPHQPITICLANGKQETFTTPGGTLEIRRDSATRVMDR